MIHFLFLFLWSCNLTQSMYVLISGYNDILLFCDNDNSSLCSRVLQIFLLRPVSPTDNSSSSLCIISYHNMQN
jgi:hypothetical protein